MTTAEPIMVELTLPILAGIAPTGLLRLTQMADEARLDAVVCGEVAGPDAVSILAAAAPLTRRIRLATNILAVVTRSPSLLAMTASTMADLTAGRFVLGLGAGSSLIAGFHGTTFEHPVDRVAHWLTALKQALAGEAVNSFGSFKLNGIQPAAVPLILAAINPRMLALAGQMADGVALNLCGPEQAHEYGSSARDAAARAGRTGPFEVHTTLWLDESGDPEQGRQRFALEMAPYLAVPTYRRAVVGMSDEDAIDRVTDVFRTKGRKAAAALFPHSIIDQLVATDGADARAKIALLAAAGCTGVQVVPLVPAGSPAPGDVTIATLAEVVRDLRTADHTTG